MIDFSQLSPGFTIKVLIAVVLWIWAAFVIMYHHRGTEWVGAAMVIVGAFLFISHPTNPAPWVLLIAGFLFHVLGRFFRSKGNNKKTSK